jgi:hypothetical protein
VKKHISYSEWKDWAVCPYYHKLVHIDKLKGFEGNIYTAFGKALHETIEVDITKDKVGNIDEMVSNFQKILKKEIKSLPEEEKKKILSDFDIRSWLDQGTEIVKEVYSALTDRFGEYGVGWEVLAAEERLYEDVNYFDTKKKFKGFIDLIVYNKLDEKIYLIDWKTTSWGWNSKKKSDSTLAYQLAFYKYFYSQKYDVDMKDVETFFVLLKRTAKVGKKVEFVRVTTGPRRIENALNALKKAIYNIDRGNYIKNKLNCKNCEKRFGTCTFYNTEHCS